jgi:CheY-like chemotaxis protein
MSSPRPQQSSVLVIDDEPRMLDEVTAVLTRANFACRCCTTPEAALAAAEASPPDLILTDTNLHGHTGVELCEQIRSHLPLARLPVMFLSSGQGPDIIRRSDAAGGSYYLRKPFDPEVLVELIDKAIGARQLA